MVLRYGCKLTYKKKVSPKHYNRQLRIKNHLVFCRLNYKAYFARRSQLQMHKRILSFWMLRLFFTSSRPQGPRKIRKNLHQNSKITNFTNMFILRSQSLIRNKLAVYDVLFYINVQFVPKLDVKSDFHIKLSQFFRSKCVHFCRASSPNSAKSSKRENS